MSKVCVQVAVRIRPMLAKELLQNQQPCVQLIPGTTQVQLGLDRLYSFDQAFGPTASQDEVYESCVQPLVKSLINGYNATVFCYGQTGSGKTYTLGGRQDEEGGVIDCVAQDLFLLLEEKGKNGSGVEAKVEVSYMELYMEELQDLMEPETDPKSMHIREDMDGNTVVIGAKQKVVASAEELLSIVEAGNALRHIGNTRMNEHSSRSHTILTIQVIQYCQNKSSKNNSLSKLCMVDLAGSERNTKTGNTGERLKESNQINTDLLALGNVIRALSDPGRNRGKLTYIPYRGAKITRLLRDSLGGTAHTLMVACVSPSDYNLYETLGVLEFASKARHIHNHPTVKLTRDGQLHPTTWGPSGDRCDELEDEIRALRELLKDKEKEITMKLERTGGRLEGMHSTSKFYLLAQEAAALLADISNSTTSDSFRQRVQDWQERLTAVSHSHQANDEDSLEADAHQYNLATVSNLREELNKFKIIPGPLAHSVERVMATLKEYLLQAEAYEKDEVYPPATKQQTETTEEDRPKERVEDTFVDEMGLWHSLHRTWTVSQDEEENLGQDQTPNRSPSARQSQKARDQDTHALVSDGAHSVNGKQAGVLKRLSFGSQQDQAELHCSLGYKRGQRSQLQTSFELQRESRDNINQLELHAGRLLDEEEELQHPAEVLQHHCSLQDRALLSLQDRAVMLQVLEEELKRREEVLLHKGDCLQQINDQELCSPQDQSQDSVNLSMQSDSLEEQLQRSSSGRQTEGVTIKELEEEKDMLKEQRDSQLKVNRLLTAEEESSLLQLKEAIKFLDAALELKNSSTHGNQNMGLITDSSSCQSRESSRELSNVIRMLKRLTPSEVSKLLIKYVKEVISLSEVEHHLRLRCDELYVKVGNKDDKLREQEIAMQNLTLDTDQRLTQQQHDHQNNIQLLLQNGIEGISGEERQAMHCKMKHLEKKLSYYRGHCRQLKQKTKASDKDTPKTVDDPSHTQKPKRMDTEHTELPESDQIHTQSQREREADVVGLRSEMTKVRLCRSKLRQIPRL